MSAGLQSRCSLEQSRRLWSLSALMLKKAALEFGRVCAQLQQLESACEMARRVAPQITTDHTGFLASVANTILGNLKRVCISGGLDNVLPEVERFGVALLGDFTIVEIKAKAEHLRLRLYDELENEFYFQVSRQDVAIYDQKELFGPAVAKKFKNAATDIAKAGNCLALQEPTACVFHLMRAMEVAVRRLSKRLGITITPQTTWRQMTGSMDGKIRALPDRTEPQKRKKNDWEAARANLHHVGSVWRNNTMHPATSYTPSQARDVLNAVRVFMCGLCDL